MPAVAFFDVDNTLMKGYSGFFATLALLKGGILKKRRLFQALFYRLVGPLTSGKGSSQELLRRMYGIAMTDMAGSRLEEILEIGRDCFEKRMKPRLYREGIEAIKRHKEEGDPVYLITSGPTMVIRWLAEFLGVDGEFSAGPVIDSSGRLTREIRMPITYREGKVAAAEEAVRKHRARWEACTYYADSADDLYLLEKVGHPVLVNPDWRLKRIGKERRWPVLLWGPKSNLSP